MQKDFDEWNKEKTRIHHIEKGKLYRKREIWWCALGTNIGFEQDGTGKVGERPVLVVRGFSPHVCIVIPLTTSKKSNPYYISIGVIDGKEASVIISQLRLLDTRRLINKIGCLDQDSFKRIIKSIRNLF